MKSPKGYVYFAIEQSTGNVKIGHTSLEPIKRLKAANCGNSGVLQLVGYIKSDDRKKLEKDLHEKFEDLRIRGEWFKPSPELVFYIWRNSELDWETTDRLSENRIPWYTGLVDMISRESRAKGYKEGLIEGYKNAYKSFLKNYKMESKEINVSK